MNVDDRILESMSPSPQDDNTFGINHEIYYTQWFLRFLGIWPLVASKPSAIDRIAAKILLPLASISMTILVVPILFFAVENGGSIDILVLLGPIIFQITNVLKHLIMVFHSSTIKLSLEHMAADWRRIDDEKDRDFMKKNIRVGHGITVICTFCMYSGAISYHIIMPLWAGNTLDEFNQTVRPLAYPGTDRFLDLSHGFVYEIVFVSNCISAFFHFSVVTGICNLAAIFVSHACGQIQIIISRIERLVDETDDQQCQRDADFLVVEKRIAFIISSHVRVLGFSSRIDEILRQLCLMEVGASTMIICMLEYYCMTEWSNSSTVAMLTYVVLLLSECFNVYIFCYIGELLKEKLSKVGKASYLIEWYRMPGKTSLSLVLIIAMSNYPRKLTAGGMIELSITSFGDIMKTSIGFLNMVRTVAM